MIESPSVVSRKYPCAAENLTLNPLNSHDAHVRAHDLQSALALRAGTCWLTPYIKSGEAYCSADKKKTPDRFITTSSNRCFHCPSLCAHAAHLDTRRCPLIVGVAWFQLLNTHATKRWLFSSCRRPFDIYERDTPSLPAEGWLILPFSFPVDQGEETRPNLYSICSLFFMVQ